MHHSFLYGYNKFDTMLRCDIGRVLDNLVELHDFTELLLSNGEVGSNFEWARHCLERRTRIFLVLIYVNEKVPGSLI